MGCGTTKYTNRRLKELFWSPFQKLSVNTTLLILGEFLEVDVTRMQRVSKLHGPPCREFFGYFARDITRTVYCVFRSVVVREYGRDVVKPVNVPIEALSVEIRRRCMPGRSRRNPDLTVSCIARFPRVRTIISRFGPRCDAGMLPLSLRKVDLLTTEGQIKTLAKLYRERAWLDLCLRVNYELENRRGRMEKRSISMRAIRKSHHHPARFVLYLSLFWGKNVYQGSRDETIGSLVCEFYEICRPKGPGGEIIRITGKSSIMERILTRLGDHHKEIHIAGMGSINPINFANIDTCVLGLTLINMKHLLENPKEEITELLYCNPSLLVFSLFFPTMTHDDFRIVHKSLSKEGWVRYHCEKGFFSVRESLCQRGDWINRCFTDSFPGAFCVFSTHVYTACDGVVTQRVESFKWHRGALRNAKELGLEGCQLVGVVRVYLHAAVAEPVPGLYLRGQNAFVKVSGKGVYLELYSLDRPLTKEAVADAIELLVGQTDLPLDGIL